MTDAPFPMIEKALRELITEKMPEATSDRIGGDLSYDAGDEFYVWLGLVTGSTTTLDGSWTIDIDVFDDDYTQAMGRALALEAILLTRGGHRTSLMLIDNVSQNEVPILRPWDDESAFRVGATYTFTARRTGMTPEVITPPAGPASIMLVEGSGPPDGTVPTAGTYYLDADSGDLWTV